MSGNEFIPGQNKSVIRMLSKEFGRYNKGRNRILMVAASLCIITLTMVFGIAYGKVQAEYTKAVRTSGTAASACVEEAGSSQYGKIRSLGYVKQVGRRLRIGSAYSGDKPVCRVQALDDTAWEEMTRPAYTDIHGHYPKEAQEIMLSVNILEDLGISIPREGMKIGMTVNIGFFRTAEEEFSLSGWYTDYVPGQLNEQTGYISEEKCKEWGYDMSKESDVLIVQSDSMSWQDAEKRLHEDVAGAGSNLKISVRNTFTYDAVNRLVGSYGMAALGALVILSGMFFLIYNVMQISMAGDIRQMGLLYTIGTTKKQIRRIYLGQIRDILVPGVIAGTAVSAAVLRLVIPEILGKQYLSGYGGASGLRIFRPQILAAAVVFVVLLILIVALGAINRTVKVSCVESINYTGNDTDSLNKNVPSGKRHGLRNAVHAEHASYGIRDRKIPGRRKSAGEEICYMAWQNLTRRRGRFLAAVFSLFLGMAVFLGTIVITKGSDYVHVIEKRPDFLIAGKFSNWGQEEGYGNEYQTRDAGEDPMETKGDNFALLYGNDYDEFAPVPSDVREQILSLDGVERDCSYIMEGAYMTSTISGKGMKPLVTDVDSYADSTFKEGVGYGYGYEMVEGFDGDTLQILNDDELTALRDYVERKSLAVDMDSLEDGTGVMILHDHSLSPRQEQDAKESVGEPMYFTALRTREEWEAWYQMSPEERDAVTEDKSAAETAAEDNQKAEDRLDSRFTQRHSDTFTLCGYLDNRAEDFPDIRQTWHGAEGTVYYLISRQGFKKLPTEKKTLYMEVNVKQEKEAEVKAEIREILSRENRKRDETPLVTDESETGEAGIFCISKSDLLTEAANDIRGNRMILGSISIVLLFAGLMNYSNVMAAGILSRKKELEIMEKIGMTRKQRRMLLTMEGVYYSLIVSILILTAGSGILKCISMYMEKKLSYFVFSYPVIWVIILIAGLTGVCLSVPVILYCPKKISG